MPRFTVVIPLFNKENYIQDTLKSVLKQTVTDFEIIIINDCSTDQSFEKAQAISDSRIQYLEHSVNKGLSASRNTGIKVAKADYIAFLDADDTWKPTFLETINSLIETYPETSLFATKYEVLLKNGKTIHHDFHIEGVDKHGVVANFFASNLNQNFYYPSCLCVHKKVFEKVGYYNEAIRFSEDVDFNIRAHAVYKMAYHSQPLVQYAFDSENQITQKGLGDKIIPDYDRYEAQFKDRKDIKKYLDFQRYVKGKMYKLGGDKVNFRKMVDPIDPANLSWKQRLLLKLPNFLLHGIRWMKLVLQNLGISVNSYQK
ncbi:glycosyltransferase family A protein [Aureisphaera galaxeae]|uniref:glycosyltransferase family 2 protein n=1 Tax=Aureisphaera galaxeae TaxID=1538023 RepID=UPI0023500EF2|nr:glycosyltransferase family A protein [Aureisphaera galaxeae]MDC8004464.1 glycosyltransferase family A protein [Aureisphaera galaxeae]